MYYLISSISEKIRFKYVANVEFYYLISHGFCSLVLVKISVSILLDGGCKNVLIKHILAVEVNARAVNVANNEQGGGMYGSLVITGKFENQNSTQLTSIFSLHGTTLRYREWEAGGGQMQESPCPGVNILGKNWEKTIFNVCRFGMEWSIMDEGDSFGQKMEVGQVRTKLWGNFKNIYQCFCSLNIWKLGQDQTFSCGLLRIQPSNVRKKSKNNKKIKNVLLGTLLVSLL